MEEPFLVMIAGPNGAGKTTLTDRLRRERIDLGEYINPDDIAGKLKGSLAERSTQAQQIAEQERERCISEKRSFTFETVMSHPSKVEILLRAKEAGFFVQLIFVGTDDPKTNIDRVANRVAQRGHDVPTDKIIGRWDRSMALLQEAIRAADEALVFDNSLAGFIDGGPRLVFRRKILQSRNLPQSDQYPPIPNWVRHYVLNPLGIRSFESPTLSIPRSIISPPFGLKANLPTRTSDFILPAIPHDLEIEQSFLGTLLVDNGTYSRGGASIEPKQFFEPIHQRIFEIIVDLIRANKKANADAVQALLPPHVSIAGLSVNEYLQILVGRADEKMDIPEFGRVLSNLAFRREFIMVCEDAANAAHDASASSDPSMLISAVERRLDQLQTRSIPETQPARLNEALNSAVDRAARAYARDGSTLGIAAGFIDLDRVTSGFEPSQLIVIAGRPSMGKTALVTCIAYNVAKSWKAELGDDSITRTVAGGIVGFFSLDSSAEQVATRIIAQQTGIPANKIQTGNIAESDFERLKDVAIELQHLPLYIDDAGTVTIAQLILRAKRLKRERGLDLLIIDNLELLQSATERSPTSKARDTKTIVSELKALAKELSIPVIVLSELPPKVDERPDKHPRLTDFKDLAAIEHNTDLVIFIYREEHYVSDQRPLTEDKYAFAEWLMQMDRVHGFAELVIARNKNGNTGMVRLIFDNAIGRFDDLDQLNSQHTSV